MWIWLWIRSDRECSTRNLANKKGKYNMSERSQKAFVEAMVQYPEMDDDERMDEFEDDAIYQSSSIDLQDTLGKNNFKFIYPILIKDIIISTFDNQKIFCQKMLEKIVEIYDFTFPEKPELTMNMEIKNCLDFIKFLEYDNIIFLSLVWQHLNINLLTVNIKSYSISNQNKIIKEVEEQLETHEQNELISTFLRTYYKSKFIEWFIEQSERSKTQILLEIFEREGKLNGWNNY